MEGQEGADGLPEIFVSVKDYVAESRALSAPFSKLPSCRNITRCATFVAQRAILMLLEPIYETDFLPCSFGFRPGQSAHDALHSLRSGIMDQGHRWVIDADLSKYFDSIDHKHLRTFLDLRIKDGVVRRMIDKWLKAGVLEENTLRRSETGTPQGGVITP